MENGQYARQGGSEPKDKVIGSLIVRIGERSNKSLESNLELMSNVLVSHIDLYEKEMLAYIAGAIMGQPQKLCIYSTLLGLVNAKKPEFVEIYTKYVTMKLIPDALRAQRYEQCLTLVKSLADCVNANVVSSKSLLELYEVFYKVTLEDSDNSCQNRKDFYVSLILKSLPYVANELADSDNLQLGHLIERLKNYVFEKRNTSYTKSIHIWGKDLKDKSKEAEGLHTLMNQILEMRSNNWDENSLMRPYVVFHKEIENCKPHELALNALDLNACDHGKNNMFPYPCVQTRFFEIQDLPEDSPTLPEPTSIDRFLLQEQIRVIIIAYHKNMEECIKALFSIPLSSRFAMDYLTVEVVISEIFSLPKPQLPLIYYFCILMELSKCRDTNFSSLVALSFEMLFDKLDIMELECMHRFTDWFSWHISNNSYKWAWVDWLDALQEDSPSIALIRTTFIKNTLAQCVGISYHSRIVRSLNEQPEVLKYMPPETKPNFMYVHAPEDGEGMVEEEEENGEPKESSSEDNIKKNLTANLANDLVKLLSTKRPNEDIFRELDNVSEAFLLTTTDNIANDIINFKTALIYQCMMKIGCKSYSHCLSVLDRYVHVLLDLISHPDANSDTKIALLSSLFSFWKYNPQMMIINLDKFISYRIVNTNNAIDALFKLVIPDHSLELPAWDMLTKIMDKIVARTHQVESEIQSIEKEMVKLEKLKFVGDKFKLSEWETQYEGLSDQCKKTESALQHVVKEQKENFLTLFQKFITTINTARLQVDMAAGETMGGDNVTKKYVYEVYMEYLVQFMRKYHKEITTFFPSMELMLFTPDLDQDLLDIYSNVKSLAS